MCSYILMLWGYKSDDMDDMAIFLRNLRDEKEVDEVINCLNVLSNISGLALFLFNCIHTTEIKGILVKDEET